VFGVIYVMHCVNHGQNIEVLWKTMMMVMVTSDCQFVKLVLVVGEINPELSAVNAKFTSSAKLVEH